MKHYHINIFYSEEDNGYIADIPDLKYCSAFGSTEEEALSEVLQAKAAWLEAAKIEGKPIPEPRYRPAIY
ncbi:type II toxin-antitoxin system HicB family antitoxin [Anabaenopsis elenkinii]|uniref:Type II toxin-antitoxin system HicB family antitoxin n=1 Tax=Anabaenopsis elenkinii CCIBt3563 TaxID=2779889 RepID=A0A7S6REY1_9CYAN|nr:type II toxin-antitoxin system HicB family antitoxin [Anabaenopsis elenkinii]QOV23540.1 type II toxin-antitoxin system HicB family antitoxin [Anabaenopsis elenkinii CCIBt3563]